MVAEVAGAGELRTLAQVHIRAPPPREQVEEVAVAAVAELLRQQELQDESQPVVQGEEVACKYIVISTDHG